MARLGRVLALGGLTFAVLANGFQSRLINGKEVQPGTYKEVIQIKSNGANCTATVVGPRVFITAAHCAANGATSTFSIGSESYTATIYRSSLYPKQEHDIALGVTTRDITGIEPVSIGGKSSKGLRLTLLGFGCTQPQGGPSDGKLREGQTVVTDEFDFFMKSYESGGAALCFGDSGGPAMITSNGKKFVLGVNSKGNIQDTNYHTRTDLTDSTNFFNQVATTAGVQICGVNKDCSGTGPVAPTCTLAASPSTVTQGQTLLLNLATQGAVSSATIDGTPVTVSGGTASKSVSATSVGSFTANAQVTGPGGTGTCQASYTVEPSQQPNAPTCSIAMNPPVITLGQASTATLTVAGNATSASIDGQAVGNTGGTLSVKPTTAGVKIVNGFVSGPGGSNSCSASLTVTSDGPQPPVTNFDLVPTHCGDNTLTETPVKTVCFAVVAYSFAKRDLSFKEAVIIENRDGSKEVAPIILRQLGRQRANRAEIYEELTYYANAMTEKEGKYQLKTQKGLLKTNPQGQAQALQGHSPSGNFFMAPNLKPIAE